MAEDNTGKILQDTGKKLIDLGKQHEERLKLLRQIQDGVAKIDEKVNTYAGEVSESIGKHAGLVAKYRNMLLAGQGKKADGQLDDIQKAVTRFDELSVDGETLKSDLGSLGKKGKELYGGWMAVVVALGDLRELVIRYISYAHSEHFGSDSLRGQIEKIENSLEKVLANLRSALPKD